MSNAIPFLSRMAQWIFLVDEYEVWGLLLEGKWQQ